MPRSAIVLLAAAACALLASCAAATSVPPAGYLVCQELAGPCTGVTPRHEPAVVYLSGDGSLWAKDVVWAGWGTATATGQGTAEENNCTPNCAQGTFSAYAITITLTKPVAWHHDMVYSSAAYSIPSLNQQYTFAAGLIPEPAPPPQSPAAPAGPGPVSSQASVTGNCTAGYEPAYATTAGGIAYGPFTAGQPSGYVPIGSIQYAPTAAYQLTLTNTGSTTAAIDGFVVAFYNASGQELGSDQRDFLTPTYLTTSQALAWQEFSPIDEIGHGLSGSDGTGGQDYSIPSEGFATCQLVEWMHP